MVAPWSLKRSFSSFSCGTCVRCSDARARRARRSALRRRAQPSNKEGLEDPTLETPLKDTGLPPSPPAPPIDGRTLFDLEVALTIAKGLAPDEDLHEALLDHMKAEAEVSPEGLADKTTTDKTSPILNDLGPVALPRIGKKERKEALEEFRKGKGKSGGARAREPLRVVDWPMPCPRHSQDAFGWWTCELCFPTPACPRHPPSGRFTCELCCPSLSAASGVRRSQWRSQSQPDSKGEVPQTADPDSPWWPQTPWPCARCNREPIDTVWRPLDGTNAFDTEERICGACWVEPESQPDSEGEPFHCELCPHCGCDPAMLE